MTNNTTRLHLSPTFYIGLALIVGATLSYLGLLDLARYQQHLNQAATALCGTILILRKIQRLRSSQSEQSDQSHPSDPSDQRPIARPANSLPRRFFHPRSTQSLAIACLALASLLALPSCSSLKPANGNVVAALAQIATTTGVQLAAQRYPQLVTAAPVVAATIRQAVATDADSVQGIRDACADCLASVVTDPTLRRVVYSLIDNILQSARDQNLTNAQTSDLLLRLADSLDALVPNRT